MLNRILRLFWLLLPTLCFADTCPLVGQFNPNIPPAGWFLLIPPVYTGNDYHFASATHSLNSSYYHLQVICRYECSPNAKNCSPFSLLSNASYTQPTKNDSPWNMTPLLVYTLVCMPPDRNPYSCVFSNVPDNATLAWVRDKKTFWTDLFLAPNSLSVKGENSRCIPPESLLS